jgi:hypothetical protein
MMRLGFTYTGVYIAVILAIACQGKQINKLKLKSPLEINRTYTYIADKLDKDHQLTPVGLTACDAVLFPTTTMLNDQH